MPRATPRPEPIGRHGGDHTRPQPCVFCGDRRRPNLVARSITAEAFPDAHPLSPGHTLIVPRRHVQSIFDLDEDKFADLWRLVHEVRGILTNRYSPAGLTVGCNDGVAAGQTVEHAHVHVIPRFPGDVDDPRGGIRWVIPAHARYWPTNHTAHG